MQVSSKPLTDGITGDSLGTHSESGQAAKRVPANDPVDVLANFKEAFASYLAGAHAAEELQQASSFIDMVQVCPACTSAQDIATADRSMSSSL